MTVLTEAALVDARQENPNAKTLAVAPDLELAAKRILAEPTIGEVAEGQEFPSSTVPDGALTIDPNLTPGAWELR